MPQSTEQLDIHPITDSAEADMAAKFIVTELWHDDELNPDNLAHAKKHLAAMDELQVGAFDAEGQMVGVAGLAGGSALGDKEWVLVADVATATGKQRTGVGTAVMNAVHDLAKSHGIQEAVIVSPTRAGLALYEKMGYQWDDRSHAYRKIL